MWNPEQELAKKAHEVAKEKHPEGYSKIQLVECSKEVYGGFGAAQINPLLARPIRTMEDISNMGNAMAQIDGHYPVGMSGCEIVGINGGCGPECPVYLEGSCGCPDEMKPRIDGEELAAHVELYGE
jgi:hypothetical protein